MTAMELIERVDLLEPNDYGPEQKLQWLSTLDGKAYHEVIEPRSPATVLPAYENGYEELLIDAPFALDIYYYYLQAMIAAENSETQRYNKRMVMFNAAYKEWSDWFNRTHLPKSAGTHFRF